MATVQLVVSHYTATSAAGTGVPGLRDALRSRRSGLRRNDLADCDIDTWIGRVAEVESVELPPHLRHFQSRNNQLAWLGLQQDELVDGIEQLVSQVGADRIGVVMGTSTSSIGRTEEAYRDLDDDGRMRPAFRQPEVHNLHSPGTFVAAATGVTGPAMTISTACSSSAKVFATASRWVGHGLVDAVLVGGVDSLCLSILFGFHSLELVSSRPCKPFDRDRDGINLGEACGYALVTRRELAPAAELTLAGYGESSDAHHMSHPHPEGRGAVLSMRRALARAGLDPADIGYVNLHGTASKANDRIETAALAALGTTSTAASSTKGWTGHALGAAGILESVITLDTLVTGLIPGTLNCDHPEEDFQFQVTTDNEERSVRYAMTNSFGFGGNNVSLVFGRLHARA